MQSSTKTIIIKNNFQVDFNLLALSYPPLEKHLVVLNYQTTINFKKQQSLITLAQAIMKTIFEIQIWQCPIKNLCPRIPSRLNYLLWIKYCLNKIDNIMIKKVIDIGTGSTLIYPLIGSSVFGWQFLATQSNQQSFQHASSLIIKNNLSSKIQIVKSESNSYLKNTISKDFAADIFICNPPFFQKSQQWDDDDYIKGVSTITQGQYCCEGGEYEFFFTLYSESYEFNRIDFGSMLIGRKQDYQDITNFLQQEYDRGMLNYYYNGRIEQGSGTGRVRGVVLWKVKLLMNKT